RCARAHPRRRRARHRARPPAPRSVSLGGVSRRYALYLVVLGAIWGSSYLFIKVGVRDLSPALLIEIRLLCAPPVLVAFAVQRQGWDARRGAWRPGVVLGVLNAAVPFTLIAWGERYVDSGTAAVTNSSVPIWLAILAIWFVPSERSTGLRAVGVALGLAGVAILAGVHPQGGWKGVLGTGAIIVASISYAAANLYAGGRTRARGSVDVDCRDRPRSVGACVAAEPRAGLEGRRLGRRPRPARDGGRADPVVPNDPPLRLVAIGARRLHAARVRAPVRR